jgi:hypothetical protein
LLTLVGCGAFESQDNNFPDAEPNGPDSSLVLNLAGGARHYVNSDGTFNLQLWKARIDTYRDVDFAPARDGLLLRSGLDRVPEEHQRI